MIFKKKELPRRAYATDFDVQNDFESDTPDNRMMAEMSYQVGWGHVLERW